MKQCEHKNDHKVLKAKEQSVAKCVYSQTFRS